MADQNKKSIYDLELHEELKITQENHVENAYVKRVPGGWIYSLYYENDSQYLLPLMIFVPYNTEFRPPIKMDDKPKQQ